jgi:type II secretory pathway component PulJ
MNRHAKIRAMAGFSLVEMMVALVAGMVVVGAVLAFTVSSVRANSDYVQSTRLMQELRNVTDYMTVELKRAGYDNNAMEYVANPTSTAVSKFAPMKIDTTAGSNCIIYAYDTYNGGTGQGALDLSAGELRGIRRRTATVNGVAGIGVIEVAESSASATPDCDGNQPDYSQYPVDCNTGSGWCPLSDPRTLDVQAFTVNTAGSGTDSNGVRSVAGGATFNAMQQRELQLTVTGALRSDASVTRTVRSNVKVRADCLRTNLAGCNAAPTP